LRQTNQLTTTRRTPIPKTNECPRTNVKIIINTNQLAITYRSWARLYVQLQVRSTSNGLVGVAETASTNRDTKLLTVCDDWSKCQQFNWLQARVRSEEHTSEL